MSKSLNTETTATGLIVLTNDAGKRVATIEYDTKRGMFEPKLDAQYGWCFPTRFYRSLQAAEYQVLAWYEEVEYRERDLTKLNARDVIRILDESGYTETGIVLAEFGAETDTGKFMYKTKYSNGGGAPYEEGRVYVWREEDGTVKADY